MKKLMSLALCLCLLTVAAFSSGQSAACAEADPAKQNFGYDFDFILRLRPEAFSGAMAKQAHGYEELLQSIRFHGSYLQAPMYGMFDLSVSVIPLDSRGEPISFQILGTEDVMFLSSPLLGDQLIRLSNYSLLAFCTKMSEHLGIPLHYLALLYPYTWTYSLEIPILDWEYLVDHIDENGIVSKDNVWFLSNSWEMRLAMIEQIEILIDALCKDSDCEEAFRALVNEIPDYLFRQLAKEQAFQIRREGDQTIWHAATGDFITESRNNQGWDLALNLPRMENGYLPVFSLEQDLEEKRQSWRLRALILGSDTLQEDLLRLEASLLSFPVAWPANFQSLLSVNLTGGLLPNIGFSAYLVGEENGHIRIEIRKPTVDYEPGPVMLTLEGDLNQREGNIKLRSIPQAELDASLDLLVANDADIRAILPDMAQPMLVGLLRFLVGIPASACQTLMDELENLGILNLVLGE